MRNLLDAALVEARKNVKVGSYTRTSKSGKLVHVGRYDQWRELPGASLKGVLRGSKVKINVGGRAHEGVVTRRKGTDVTVKTKAGLSVPVMGKEVTHVAEPSVAGAAPKSGPKKPAAKKPKLTHEQTVILDGQKGGLTKAEAQADAKASNAAARARDAADGTPPKRRAKRKPVGADSNYRGPGAAGLPGAPSRVRRRKTLPAKTPIAVGDTVRVTGSTRVGVVQSVQDSPTGNGDREVTVFHGPGDVWTYPLNGVTWTNVDNVEARLAKARAARKKAEVAPKPSRQQRTKPSPPVKAAPTHADNAPDLPTFAGRGDLVQQLAVATHTGDGIPVRRTDQKLVGPSGSPRNVARMDDTKLAHELSAVLNGGVIPPNGLIENSKNGMTLHAGIARFVEEMGKRVGGRWKDPYTGVSYQLDAVLAQLTNSSPRVKRVKQRTVSAPPMTDKSTITRKLRAADPQAELDRMRHRAVGVGQGDEAYVRRMPLAQMTHDEVTTLSQDAKRLLVQRLLHDMLTKKPKKAVTDRIASWLTESGFAESNPYDVNTPRQKATPKYTPPKPKGTKTTATKVKTAKVTVAKVGRSSGSGKVTNTPWAHTTTLAKLGPGVKVHSKFHTNQQNGNPRKGMKFRRALLDGGRRVAHVYGHGPDAHVVVKKNPKFK